jgi:hypothetical protein
MQAGIGQAGIVQAGRYSGRTLKKYFKKKYK